MTSYKDNLARTAIIYLVQTGLIALASFVLSLIVWNGFKLSAIVDLAVLWFFIQDIENLPEKAPKTKAALKRIGQAGVVFLLSLVFNDILGMLASGLLILFIGLDLFERFGNWLDKLLS